MILKFTYHQILVNKKTNLYEDFDYCLIYDSKTFDKDKAKLTRWCRKHCKARYKLNAYGCWFQTRDDAEAFKSRWYKPILTMSNLR